MIEVKKEGVLLRKTNLDFESEGVLNPAVISDGDHIHVFYRAVSKGNYSTIGYCKLKGPLIIEERLDKPLFFREYGYESHGIEDPRITKIDDLYYLSYTAYDGVNALGALAVSKDLKHFNKLGLIVPRISYDTFSCLAETNGIINEKYLRYNIHGGIHKDAGKDVFVWDKNVIFFPAENKRQIVFSPSCTTRYSNRWHK